MKISQSSGRFETLLKPCVLLVGAAMLAACQNTSTFSDSNTANMAQANLASSHAADARALFSDQVSSPIVRNKAMLTEALAAHLSSERHALGTYHYKAVSIGNPDDVDASADTLLASAIRTYEHKTNQDIQGYEPDYYRSSTDYIYADSDSMDDSLSELPYLRYDDEQLGRTPDSTVTRGEGLVFEGDYHTKRSLANSAISGFHSCIVLASYEIDDLVRDEPNISISKQAVKGQLKAISDCQKVFNQSVEDEKLLSGSGYISSDVAHFRGCALNFDKGVRQVLAPNRQTKSYDDDSYAYYNLVYMDYFVCNEVDNFNRALEPWDYLNQTSEQDLKLIAARKECALTHQVGVQKLFARGKSYDKNKEEFADNYISYINCVDGSIKDNTDKDYNPEPINELSEVSVRTSEQYSAVHGYGSYDDYEPQSRISSWFDAYKSMKAAQQEERKPRLPAGQMPNIFGSVLGSMLNHMKVSPQQVLAQNLYRYNNTALTILSHHRPQQRQSKMLYSMDYYSPTAEQSIQLPILLDFEHSKAKADVAALLPVIAMLTPKHAPLPNELPDQEMTFTLPNDLHNQLPMTVIYDATQKGVLNAFNELDGDQFTAIDISDDKFAKDIGASRAIKVNFDAYGTGQFMGVIIKHIGKALKSYVDAHPEVYEQGDKGDNIKRAIDDLAIINDGYHTRDLGGLMQIIEGVLPVDFHQANYFYLNRQGKIVGMQVIGRFDDAMQQIRVETVGQVRYSNMPFEHPLNDKFANSFSTAEEFDGTVWLSDISQEAKLKKQALEERLSYKESYDEYGDDDLYDDAEGATTTAQAATAAAQYSQD
ncbi:hypothetical protein ACSF86_04875 [Moraxella bovoculi]|uniref:hypothetical protein n=1 Tax=Moraxella bovoculi TaxID=386891 RepID=UPI003F4FF189